MVLGVYMDARGRAGEEGGELLGGDGRKVGAIPEGVGRDGDGWPGVVGEHNGCLCGITDVAKSTETHHLR